MNSFTIQSATPATLPDLFAPLPNPADAGTRLATLRQNIGAGKVSLENLLILRSERGVEGSVLLSRAVQVPAFPRFRTDVPNEGMTAFAQAIRERAEPERLLVLQDTLSPLRAAPIEAAGWVLESQHVVYETDLQARPYHHDPQVLEGGEELLGQPELQALLRDLGRADYTLADGWTLAVLREADNLLAVGAVGPSGRPSYASVDLIGVLPAARGRGLGTCLHEHLLSLAAERFTWHGGGTQADNHAMRRIYEKNGSHLQATQLYFRHP